MPMDEAAKAALFASPLRLDSLAWLVKAISIGGGIVLVLFSWNECRTGSRRIPRLPARHRGRHVPDRLGHELVTLFLALEMISIPTYILLYLPRYDNASQEAAMKYFLLSVFSSAMLLFGFSYLYGLAGTTNLPAMTEALYKAGARAGAAAVVQIALVWWWPGSASASLPCRSTSTPRTSTRGAPTVGGGACWRLCRRWPGSWRSPRAESSCRACSWSATSRRASRWAGRCR